MRAAVVTDDHTFGLADVPDPVPGQDQLVLRVLSCGICGSDLKAHKMMPSGAVLGHEFCGEVVAVGRDAFGFHEGDAVASMPLAACGRCRWCLVDEPAHCERVDLLGLGGSQGGFAEYVRVAGASTVGLAYGVGMYGVSDPVQARREAAALFGATGVHDPGQGPPPSGFDVVFECVGAPGLIQNAIEAVAVRGRVVIAGVCMVPDQVVPNHGRHEGSAGAVRGVLPAQ